VHVLYVCEGNETADIEAVGSSKSAWQ
jgi:hypothetical protein